MFTLRYSISVVAHYAEIAQPFVKMKLEEARAKQLQESDLKEEIMDLWVGIRLGEKKARIVRKLMEEALEEKQRCEEYIEDANEDIRVMCDDRNSINPKDGDTIVVKDFLDKKIDEIHSEIAGLELELMYYSRLFALRALAQKEVRDQLNLMYEFRRERLQAEATLKKDLNFLRSTLPSAIAVVQNARAAAQAAIELETSVHSVRASDRWSTLAAVKDILTSSMTPADEVRRRYKNEGYSSLTLEEKQWLVLDQVLNPSKYKWLKDQEALEKAANDGRLGYGGRRGAIWDNTLKNAALKPFVLKKTEIERIMKVSWGVLNRKEMQVRKLLSKFHDDPKLLQSTVKALATGFDSHVAERVRAKMEDTRNAEEKEWIRVDRILNPDLWKPIPKQDPLYERKGKGVMRASHADLLGMQEMKANEGGKALLDKLKEVGGKASFARLVKAAEISDTEVQFSVKKKWECPFTREQVLEIWKKRRTELRSIDERKVQYLLKKYNGSYDNYIEWESNRAKENKTQWTMVNHFQVAESVDIDIDARARKILTEIDQVTANSNDYIDSVVLNSAKQRFPKSVLLMELEDELDKLLISQMTTRERKVHYLLESSAVEEEQKNTGNARNDAKVAAENLQREVVLAQKAYLALKEKALMIEKTHDLDPRMPGVCMACRNIPCVRKPHVDMAEVSKRMEVLNDELQFVRINPDLPKIDSIVPRSVAEGGPTLFTRQDLIFEIEVELRELRLSIRLNDIDEELHKAHNTRKEYMWLKALHGYDMVMWMHDALPALTRERDRLVARTLAVEVVDGILEWMLEGWYFGERESEFTVAGFVPSIDPSAPVGIKKPTLSSQQAREAARKKKDLEILNSKNDLYNKRKFALPPSHPESIWHPTGEKVVKPGNVHDQNLKKIKIVLKFGLYCVAAMYFRAIFLLRNPGKVQAELQRGVARKMLAVPIQNAQKSDEVGKKRQQLRTEKEEEKKRRKFCDKVSLARREIEATQLIQRVIRGHIGRKAGLKYALKVLEYRAFRSLIYACVITVQRVYRGYKGRRRAARIREGIAKLIIDLARIDEDEAELKQLLKKLK